MTPFNPTTPVHPIQQNAGQAIGSVFHRHLGASTAIGRSSRLPHSAHEPSYSADGDPPIVAIARLKMAAEMPEPQLVMIGLVTSIPASAKALRSSGSGRNPPLAMSC